MGIKFFDQYSLLHFAVGVIARHWQIGFGLFFILHTLFEFTENTEIGMKFINTYISAWPGGKPYADSLLNCVGDTVFALIGWLISDAQLQTQ